MIRQQGMSALTLLIGIVALCALLAVVAMTVPQRSVPNNPSPPSAEEVRKKKLEEQAKKIEQERADFEAAEAKRKQKTAYEQAEQALVSLTHRWEDAVQVASASPRMSLAVPVAELQSIRRETQELSLPDCLSNARLDLAISMELTIKSFLAFMAQDPAPPLFADAARHMETFRAKRGACTVESDA